MSDTAIITLLRGFFLMESTRLSEQIGFLMACRTSSDLTAAGDLWEEQ
jgi:hypothetical protein